MKRTIVFFVLLLVSVGFAQPIPMAWDFQAVHKTDIGSLVQAYDPNLLLIAALSPITGSMFYWSSSTAVALVTSTSFGRTLLTYANEGAFKAGVNLEAGVDVQAYDDDLTTWAGLTPSAFFQTLPTKADANELRPSLELGVINVKDYPYNATGDGVTDDVVALQAAATAAAGSVLFLPKGTYHCHTAISIPANTRIIGAGKYASTLDFPVGVDGLLLGANDALASNFHFSDFGISNGRYQVRLNNVTSSVFENLFLSGGTDVIYMEGQNEVLTFRNLQFAGFTSHGFLCGQLNGGDIYPYNFPVMQKCKFDHIVLAGGSGSTSFGIDAGIDAGIGYVSGYSSFSNIISQGAETCVFDISSNGSGVYNISLDHITNETNTLPAANTYSVIKLGSGVGFCEISNCMLAGWANDHTTYKYCIEQNGGWLSLRNTAIAGGAAGTADIYMAGAGGLIENCSVTDGTTGIILTAGAASKTLLVNVFDTSNVLITNWAAGINWMGASSSGIMTNSLIARDYLKLASGRYWDGSGNEFQDGTPVTVIPKADGKVWHLRRDTDNASLLKIYSDPIKLYAYGDFDVPASDDFRIAGARAIDPNAFGSSWNGSTVAPDRNAVYDWGHTFDTDDDGLPDVLDSTVSVPDGFRLGDSGEPNMIIDETGNDISFMGGNVGVGTTGPVNKLDVIGDVNVTGALKVNGVDHTGDSSDPHGATLTQTNLTVNTAVILPSRASGLDMPGTANIFNPGAIYDLDPNHIMCVFDPNTAAACKITRIQILCSTDPTTEFDWDLYYADTIRGENATLIAAVDTVAGKFDSGAVTYSVPANKAYYLKAAAAPDYDLPLVVPKLTVDYD